MNFQKILILIVKIPGKHFSNIFNRLVFNDNSLIKFLTSGVIFKSFSPHESIIILFHRRIQYLKTNLLFLGRKHFWDIFLLAFKNYCCHHCHSFFPIHCLVSFVNEFFNQSESYDEFKCILQKEIELYSNIKSFPLNAYFLCL